MCLDFSLSEIKEKFSLSLLERESLFAAIDEIPASAQEMLAAQIYNQNKGVSLETIFGVVTTGSLWVFLKLRDCAIWIDRDEYHISSIGKILGIFDVMLNSANSARLRAG